MIETLGTTNANDNSSLYIYGSRS